MTINDYVGVRLDTEKKRNEFISFCREKFFSFHGVIGLKVINGFFQDNMQNKDLQYILYSNELDVENYKDIYWMLGKVSFNRIT